MGAARGVGKGWEAMDGKRTGRALGIRVVGETLSDYIKAFLP